MPHSWLQFYQLINQLKTKSTPTSPRYQPCLNSTPEWNAVFFPSTLIPTVSTFCVERKKMHCGWYHWNMGWNFYAVWWRPRDRIRVGVAISLYLDESDEGRGRGRKKGKGVITESQNVKEKWRNLTKYSASGVWSRVVSRGERKRKNTKERGTGER